MCIFIDDGSTSIKMPWEQDGETLIHISPNSFKRDWSTTFGSGKPFDYTVDDKKRSFDPITPGVLLTDNIDWQYSLLNSTAAHCALPTSGLKSQNVEIVVTLPLTEFRDEDAQYYPDSTKRGKKSLLRDVKLNKGMAFNIMKVTVCPESIPTGVSLCNELKPSHSVLIIDPGGTTLDIPMVAGQMTSVSRIYGDPKLDVSLVTDAAKLVLARANTDTSSYNVDRIVVNRHDEEYPTDNINDLGTVFEVKKVIDNSIERLTTRVLMTIDSFRGYLHVTVIGGGASSVVGATRECMELHEDRFVVAEEPRFALVRGLKIVDQGASMTLNRRKVLIYLYSDISASRCFADTKTEAHHRGDHGDMSRTALLAGLALGEVDSRLPSMLAVLLARDIKPETLRRMLVSFLEVQPAFPAPAAASAIAPTKVPEPPTPVSEGASTCNPADPLPG